MINYCFKILGLIICSVFLMSCANSSSDKVGVGVGYDKELTNFAYPFSVNYFNFESQNQKLKMAYMQLNKQSSKIALLLHGKNFAGFYWE